MLAIAWKWIESLSSESMLCSRTTPAERILLDPGFPLLVCATKHSFEETLSYAPWNVFGTSCPSEDDHLKILAESWLEIQLACRLLV